MESGTSSPISGPRRVRSRLSCRRLDKLFCLAASYFPLLFVYGTTTWAIYTEAYSICWRTVGGYKGFVGGTLGLVLYVMAIWSYTHAVFTNPGSPLDDKHGYSHLPTTEPISIGSVTVKSDGQERFCKKCQCRKPDRAHHCSSCRSCVLKMDHHCPWLANCLGLYNYKAFLLFLIYTTLLCFVCFGVSCRLVYVELFRPRGENGYPSGNMGEDLAPVNWVLLAVVSGIIGLVLGGFTVWHLVLTGSNMTTIESLEKVRYTAPSLRTGAAPPGARLVDNFSDSIQERQHEFNRYNNYLLEESSKKLPHAFNLGRKRNFAAVFGGKDKMWAWGLPMFSGSGDGWNWETSGEWKDAAEALRLEREEWMRAQGERERAAGWGYDPAEEQAWNRGNSEGLIKHAGQRQSKAERILGKAPGSYTDSEDVPMRKLSRPTGLHDNISDEENEYDDLEAAKAYPQSNNRNPVDTDWGSWGN
ncbi:DHHC palmitoyltransferase-domain-containing protein [Geopyxis carbonaria]|nr:DHHC palmitoyltransferase-domain-containing protein [Geopyxis carbonaria]